MQEHHQEPQQEFYALPASGLNLPASINDTRVGRQAYTDAASSQVTVNQIEDYLDHICAPLVTSVPYEARCTLRQEMRQHLQAATSAHIELGSAPEEAVTQALTQFGEARQIARQWLDEWQRTSCSENPLSRVTATLIALSLLGLTTLSAGGLAMLPGPSSAWLITAIFLMSALMGGMTIGILLRSHALRATFYATFVLSISSLSMFTALWGWKTAIAFGLAPLLCGLTLACPGAYVGNRWLRRRFRKWIVA